MKLEELKCKQKNINLDEYIKFREQVKMTMTEKDWLGDFTKEELTSLLENGSKIWIYYKEEEPVCSMMIIPSTKKDMDKFDLSLDFHQVIDYGPMMVNRKYVGNGLQYQMLRKLEEYCSKTYSYALTTIHPENKYSIHNLVKDGFELIGQKELKRGMRNIYLKKY